MILPAEETESGSFSSVLKIFIHVAGSLKRRTAIAILLAHDRSQALFLETGLVLLSGSIHLAEMCISPSPSGNYSNLSSSLK